MPYRDDARTEDLAARLEQARARLERAELALEEARLEAETLDRSLDEERRRLDVEVANAEDQRRAAVHAGLARADAPSPTLRDRVRTQAVVAALERTMAARRSSRPPAPPPGDPLAVLQGGSARRAEARRQRAVLAVTGQARLARVTEALEAARREESEARAQLLSIEALAGAHE